MRPEQPRPYVFALARVLTEYLLVARRSHDLAPTMAFLHRSIVRSQAALAAARIACTEGCWFCCSRWVDVKAPEALHIARSLRGRPELVAAVVAANEEFGGRSFEQRKRMVTPCPMLADLRCAIYADRPLACRSAVSRDAATCERSYLRTDEPMPRPVVYNIVSRAHSLALTAGLVRAGLDHHAYELTGVLRRACSEPDAERRWLDGEDLFAGIARGPGDLRADPQMKAFLEELDRQ